MAREKISDIISPRENPNLWGHEATEQRFLQEFSRGLTHHAYLISGARGIGKATLAFRLARFVLGRDNAAAEMPSLSLFGDAPEPEPVATSLQLDPEEAIFRRVASGAHSDLRTLTPAEDSKKHIISVEAAREIPRFLSLTPAEGAWRVVIVDAADDLNPNAANALLKTIEEPPPRAMIFLISHQPERLLPTIRSRCRHYALRTPDAAAFAEVLRRIAPEIESDRHAPLYALSYGSPGFAVTLEAEDGIAWYQGWLNAMHPRSAAEERQKFADRAAQQKSPEAWDVLMHGWRTALHRLSLHPQFLPPIYSGEEAALAAIAAAVPPASRARWREQGHQLSGATDAYNLEKRQTVRLLLDAGLLDRMAA